jgi:lipase chaperone LimK
VKHPRISRQQAAIGAVVVLGAIAAGAVSHWQSGRGMVEPAYWRHEVVLAPVGADSFGQTAHDEPSIQTALASMFVVDGQGRLLVEHATKAALDALWWELSETADTLTLERVQAELQTAVPGAAGKRAAALLGKYQAYRQELGASLTAETQDGAASLERQLQRQITVRQGHFDDATARLLFGEEEAYWRLLAASMRIEEDESLTAAQKSAHLQELHARFGDRQAETAAPGR